MAIYTAEKKIHLNFVVFLITSCSFPSYHFIFTTAFCPSRNPQQE